MERVVDEPYNDDADNKGGVAEVIKGNYRFSVTAKIMVIYPHIFLVVINQFLF